MLQQSKSKHKSKVKLVNTPNKTGASTIVNELKQNMTVFVILIVFDMLFNVEW